jgi:hypothetical protein
METFRNAQYRLRLSPKTPLSASATYLQAAETLRVNDYRRSSKQRRHIISFSFESSEFLRKILDHSLLFLVSPLLFLDHFRLHRSPLPFPRCY